MSLFCAFTCLSQGTPCSTSAALHVRVIITPRTESRTPISYCSQLMACSCVRTARAVRSLSLLLAPWFPTVASLFAPPRSGNVHALSGRQRRHRWWHPCIGTAGRGLPVGEDDLMNIPSLCEDFSCQLHRLQLAIAEDLGHILRVKIAIALLRIREHVLQHLTRGHQVVKHVTPSTP